MYSVDPGSPMFGKQVKQSLSAKFVVSFLCLLVLALIDGCFNCRRHRMLQTAVFHAGQHRGNRLKWRDELLDREVDSGNNLHGVYGRYFGGGGGEIMVVGGFSGLLTYPNSISRSFACLTCLYRKRKRRRNGLILKRLRQWNVIPGAV